MKSLCTLFIAAFFLILSPVLTEARWFGYDPSANEEFFEIMNLFDDASKKGFAGVGTDELIARLESFVMDHPNAEATDEALIRLAAMYVERKDFESASTHYRRHIIDFPTSRFAPDALYGLGVCRYRHGDFNEATDLLKTLDVHPLATVSLKVKATGLLIQIDSVTQSGAERNAEDFDGGGYGIGVLLPLKGSYSRFGERALKGVLLAAEVFGSGDTSVEVHARDVGQVPADAEDEVVKLAGNPKLMGLIGPLLSSTAPRVAKRAERERVPVITLSQKEGLPDAGPYVFRNFLTISKQAATLASYSYKILGQRNFAVLYPDNSYGREFAKFFAEEVVKLGGEVVGVKSYVEGQVDFAHELTDLFAIEVVERMEGRRRIREYTSGVEVDALLIPDNYNIIGQVAPYLAFYNIKEITLLGSSVWNSPELIKLAGEYVEGAIFVDGFYAASRNAETVEFVASFRELYGYEPGLLEAESYDAAMIFIRSLQRGWLTRRDVRDSLTEMDEYRGVAGPISFNAEGEAQKELVVLTVEGGKIKELERPFVPFVPPFEEGTQGPYMEEGSFFSKYPVLPDPGDDTDVQVTEEGEPPVTLDGLPVDREELGEFPLDDTLGSGGGTSEELPDLWGE